MLHDIIQARGLSKPHFCNLTGLDEVYYRRTETNPDTKPSKRAIVAVACGLDMDLDTTNCFNWLDMLLRTPMRIML